MSEKELTTSHLAARSALVPDTQLAVLLGVSVKTLRKWRLYKNRGPRFYRLGGAIRYDLQESLDWARSNPGGGTQ